MTFLKDFTIDVYFLLINKFLKLLEPSISSTFEFNLLFYPLA